MIKPSDIYIETLDPAINKLIDHKPDISILGNGYLWSEGPVWVPVLNALLFSDIPRNNIHIWKADTGVELWLNPSGYTGQNPRGGELGSNGLTLDRQHRLILCQHGDRCVSRMNITRELPIAEFEVLSEYYEGKRLNSPNDVISRSDGSIYFTDPAYGLEYQMDDPSKELDFQGVYRIDNGRTTLLTKELSRPNGLAFTSDEKRLYVGNSDENRAIWMRYDVSNNGELENGELFFDATPDVPEMIGLPDGMKIDESGNLFATGPGGVLIINPNGKLLGRIRTPVATANCAFGGDDYRTLFLTSHMYLIAIRLKTRGHRTY